MFDKLKRLTRSKATEPTPTPEQTPTQADPRSAIWSFDFAKGQAFDTTYPSVKAIANEFVDIIPYAIDANGKPLKSSLLTDILARPNQQMSGADFREALATLALTHRTVYILVYHKGDKLTPRNFTGFGFLQDPEIRKVDGVTYYKIGNTKIYTDAEVITISAGVDPYDIRNGYAPTTAAKKWADIDDYIAAFEAGLFENGAVPAGEFIITAPTVDAFNDIVDTMQAKHRGAGNNNNVTYVHRPIGADGKASAEQVQWVPFAQSNNTLDLNTIFTQVSERIDSVYGVPASIRGVNKNNTYASVKVDERIFIKRAIRPLATKIWSRFTHEMNRVTGGLGYALKFDLDLPYIAEEEKTDAERKKAELDIILTAQGAGYTLDSIVDAFGLSNAYKTLKMAENSNNTTHIENDKPQVDEGGEVESAPDTEKAEKSATTCTCDHIEKALNKSGREIADATRQMLEQQIETIAHAIETGETLPPEYDQNGDGIIDEQDIAILRDQMPQPTTDDYKAFANTLKPVIASVMVRKGNRAANEIIELLRVEEIEAEKPELEPTTFETVELQQHLIEVAEGFMGDTVDELRTYLDKLVAELPTWERLPSKNEIANAIRGQMQTKEWRVQRVARTEEHRADQNANIAAADKIQAQIGQKGTIYKVWHRNLYSNSCEFCRAIDGTRKLVGEAFCPIEGAVIGVDGGIMANNYQDINGAYMHPNCNCYTTFEVKRSGGND